MTAVVWLAGAGFAAGAWLVWSGFRPRPTGTTTGVRNWLSAVDPRRIGVAAGLGLAALVVTRWPVVGAAAAVGGWVMPLPGLRREQRRRAQRTEALAAWAEMLRDGFGTARGVEGVLTATAASAPEGIAPELNRMATRLQHQPLDVVLDQLAAELDDKTGDLVVTALRLAASASPKRVRGVLSDLAEAAHSENSMRQRVDVARTKTRTAVRVVTLIVAVFIIGLLVFARSYLAPYATPAGQVALLGVGVYWGLAFWWLAKLGRLAPVERFLVPREQS